MTETVIKDIHSILEIGQHLFTQIRSSRVLITGATGLVGSMLVRLFHEANSILKTDIGIICSVRNKEKASRVFSDIVNKEDIEIVNGTDAACDHIIHTVSPTTSSFFITYPVETIKSSVLTTIEILELAKHNDASVVYLSSMEQYGIPYNPGEIMTEDHIGVIDHLSIRSSYSESKRLCECLCSSYASEYGVNVRIARLAQTYGAGTPLSDNRMPMQFARAAADGQDIVLHTEGKSVSNCVYLSDALYAIVTLLAVGKIGEAYNICNDKEIKTVYEIAEIVANQVANGKIAVKIDIPSENMGYAPTVNMFLNADKIRNLGWEARVGIQEGYSRLVSYLREC